VFATDVGTEAKRQQENREKIGYADKRTAEAANTQETFN